MAFSPDGILFVSMPSRSGLYTGDRSGGTVFALPDRDKDGRADEVIPVIAGLRNLPHGLAFYNGYLYVAEEDSVSRYLYLGDGDVGPREVIVNNLPAAPGHSSRTIAFGGSDKMYVSIGSSCNACEESDQRRAAIMEYSPDGTGEHIFAQGIRNAVGFVFHPVTGEIWATENGRDRLGDDIPPDEINIVREGQHYGWPFCFGKMVPDPTFNDSPRCSATVESLHDLQAHSAPLGLRFIDSPLFPEEWQGDLLVAYHGSWNRSEPTGYKVVRMAVDGSKIVAEEDFIHGWLLDSGSSAGRPVDLIFGPEDGALYISDDKAGVVYRVTRVR
jgi:glucose/arabinose dehydrogenase